MNSLAAGVYKHDQLTHGVNVEENDRVGRNSGAIRPQVLFHTQFSFHGDRGMQSQDLQHQQLSHLAHGGRFQRDGQRQNLVNKAVEDWHILLRKIGDTWLLVAAIQGSVSKLLRQLCMYTRSQQL